MPLSALIRSLIGGIVCALMLAEGAIAQTSIEVPTYRAIPPHDEASFFAVLQPKSAEELSFMPLEEDASGDFSQRTHLRIVYKATTAVPVLIAFPDAPPDHHLTAILPASQNGDAILSLLPSPSWKARVRGLRLQFYWRADAPPEILGVDIFDQATGPKKFMTSLLQPLQPERFSSISLGMIAGYRLFGRPLTQMLGWPLLLLTLLMLMRRWPLKHIATLWLIVSMVFVARFSVDAVLAAVQEQREWRGDGSYNDMRHLYAMADVLRADIGSGTGSVANCSPLTTPLRYFLLPIPVAASENWGKASHGVLTTVWKDDQTAFACGAVTRSGTILKQYPTGEAVIRFTDQPQ